MIIRYKVESSHPEPALRTFEETLNFPKGFHYVRVPASIGEGALTALEISDDFHVNFQFYRLTVPLEVTKQSAGDPLNSVYFVFYQLDLPETAYIQGNEVIYDQGINVYAQPIDARLKFPAQAERNVVCIRVARSRLESMLGDDQRAYLNHLLQQENSFFVHEQMSAEILAVIQELKLPPAARALQQFFYHVRALQLIYLLMEQLNKRAITPNKNGDPDHIARIFKARALLVQDLSSPPTIASLARNVLLSESQLKQSFREIFGVSIYQYFQLIRLEKARQLLAENNRTVKEVGYEMGFTNIGHFSRLFERLYHVKPKKFQLRQPQEED